MTTPNESTSVPSGSGLTSQDEGYDGSPSEEDSGDNNETKDGKTDKIGKIKKEKSKVRHGPYRARKSSKVGNSSSSSESENKDGPRKISTIQKREKSPMDQLCLLVTYIRNVFSLDKFKDMKCIEEASRVANISIVMMRSLQFTKFLAMFSHSISCRVMSCSTTCNMFKRIRNHVENVDHECSVLQVFGQLMKMHVDTCHSVQGACGMRSCEALRALRQRQNHKVLPRNFRVREESLAEAFAALKASGVLIEQSQTSVVLQEIPESAMNLSDKLQ